MNKTIRILGLVAVLGAAGANAPLFAQDLPRPMLTIETSAHNFVPFSKSAVPALTSQESSIASVLFSGSLVYPIIADQGRTMFFFQTGYRQRQLSYRDWPIGISRELDNIHEATVSATARQQLGERWSVSVNLTAQAASDFGNDKLTSKDMKYSAAMVTERRMSDRLDLGLGAAFTSTFGSLMPIPIVTLRWNDGGRWSASANLPSTLDLWYRTSKRVRLGLVAVAEGQQYHVSIMPEDSRIENPELQYLSVNFGPALKITAQHHVAVALRGGVTLQYMAIYDGDDKLKNTDYNLEPSGFVQLSTEISF